MDDPNLRLVLQIQLQDALDLKASLGAGNGNATTSDLDGAIALYEQEFRRLETLHSDQIMTRSITQAMRSDLEAGRAASAQNDQAARYHALALDVSNGRVDIDRNNNAPDRRAPVQAPANDDFESKTQPQGFGPRSAPRPSLGDQSGTRCGINQQPHTRVHGQSPMNLNYGANSPASHQGSSHSRGPMNNYDHFGNLRGEVNGRSPNLGVHGQTAMSPSMGVNKPNSGQDSANKLASANTLQSPFRPTTAAGSRPPTSRAATLTAPQTDPRPSSSTSRQSSVHSATHTTPQASNENSAQKRKRDAESDDQPDSKKPRFATSPTNDQVQLNSTPSPRTSFLKRSHDSDEQSTPKRVRFNTSVENNGAGINATVAPQTMSLKRSADSDEQSDPQRVKLDSPSGSTPQTPVNNFVSGYRQAARQSSESWIFVNRGGDSSPNGQDAMGNPVPVISRASASAQALAVSGQGVNQTSANDQHDAETGRAATVSRPMSSFGSGDKLDGSAFLTDSDAVSRQLQVPSQATSNIAGSRNIAVSQPVETAAESKAQNAETITPGSSSNTGSNKRKADEMVDKVECCTCNDEFEPSEILTAPCGDHYCRGCITHLFTLTLTDQALFPPRCCRKEMLVESARQFLGPQLVGQYLEKKAEYETNKPMYCSKPSCSNFILPAHIVDGVGTCQSCGAKTCKSCKNAAHGILDCPNDAALQEVLQLAESQHWKRCKVCSRMVELTMGCNHITCICKAQWCYVCGTKWPSRGSVCERDCPLFNEDILNAQAEGEVHANDVPVPAIPRFNVRERLAEVIRNIRQNQNCPHNNWRKVEGGSQECPHCSQTLTFVWECTNCRVHSCNRCRRNRLQAR